MATNGAGATTNVPFTLTQDSAAPTGQSITLTGANAPYYGSASVSFTLGDGNDGSGSGLDTSSRTVTRESASLTGDSCGSFTADAGTYSSPDTSVSNGNCYRYSFAITDNVGNTSSSVTATAKVDTQAPSVSLNAPTELTGAGDQYYDGATKTQFFRPAGSGSFRLNATASDSETGGRLGELPRRLRPLGLERLDGRRRHDEPVQLAGRLHLVVRCGSIREPRTSPAPTRRRTAPRTRSR